MYWKTIAIVLVGLLVTACATGYKAAHTYNEVQVINNSDSVLRNLSVRDQRTGHVYQCGDIEPLRICHKIFGQRRFGNNPFEITWTRGEISPQAQSQVVMQSASAYFASGRSLRAVFEFSDDGDLSTYFEQESSFK